MIVIIFIIIVIIIIVAASSHIESPEEKGRKSEQELARKLTKDSNKKNTGKMLTNVYVPKRSGETVEIDAVYITRKGIYVLENKNYAGYIFGNESEKNWTVTLYAGLKWDGEYNVEKHKFYNPVWQNKSHIKYLSEYLDCDVKMFSIITFSNRGELKSIDVNSPDVFVCSHVDLDRILSKIWIEYPDVLTDERIEEIYNKILPLAIADETAMQKHVEDIHKRFSSTEICPACKGQLVIRTAKKGPNAGIVFYGCSNYPECTYTKNL